MRKVNWPAVVAGGTTLLIAGSAFAQDATTSFDAQQMQQALDQAQSDFNSAAVATTGAAAVGIGLLIFWIIFGVFGFALWLWALIDVIRRTFKDPNNKVIWLIVVLLVPWIGSLVYLIAGRKGGEITPSK